MNGLPKHQHGAALFVALVILLVVTMMGLSAMRGSIFHEKMAFNTQSEDKTFQAAETAINGVIQKARQSDAMLSDMVNAGSTNIGCVKPGQQLADQACDPTSQSDTFDTEQSLQAQATSQFDLMRNSDNSDTSALADYQFHTIGKGNYLSSLDLPFESRNRQEWRKLGPGGGPFGVPDPSKIGITAPTSP